MDAAFRMFAPVKRIRTPLTRRIAHGSRRFLKCRTARQKAAPRADLCDTAECTAPLQMLI